MRAHTIHESHRYAGEIFQAPNGQRLQGVIRANGKRYDLRTEAGAKLAQKELGVVAVRTIGSFSVSSLQPLPLREDRRYKNGKVLPEEPKPDFVLEVEQRPGLWVASRVQPKTLQAARNIANAIDKHRVIVRTKRGDWVPSPKGN